MVTFRVNEVSDLPEAIKAINNAFFCELIENPADFVTLEIEKAIGRKKQVPDLDRYLFHLYSSSDYFESVTDEIGLDISYLIVKEDSYRAFDFIEPLVFDFFSRLCKFKANHLDAYLVVNEPHLLNYLSKKDYLTLHYDETLQFDL